MFNHPIGGFEVQTPLRTPLKHTGLELRKFFKKINDTNNIHRRYGTAFVPRTLNFN
jgi:hypothetical protein